MIIGLTGKKQNGKSTAAQYIAEKYGFVRLNFKDALVAEIRERFPGLLQEIANIMEQTNYDGMNPWTVDRLFKDKPPLMRTLLQNYGTEVRRKDYDDYWVVQWLKKATKHQHVVVDDVRFLNEAQAVRDMGGVLIRIIRVDYDNTDSHSSEMEMDKIETNETISAVTGDEGVQAVRDLIDSILVPKLSLVSVQ